MRVKTFCDVCNFDLTDDAGYATVGKTVQLSNSVPEKQRAIKAFGKNKFNICYVCYLKSLGLKEVKETKIKSN